MTSRIQAQRFAATTTRPGTNTRSPGEFWLNFPDLRLGMIDPTQSAVDLLAIRVYAPTSTYAAGDFVVNAGQLLQAKTALAPKAFASTDWSLYQPATNLDARYLQLTGGTMLGTLLLSGDPTSGMAAATKAYVDAHVPAGGPFLPLSGGVLGGPLTLNADPTGSLQAATKGYVDAHIGGGGLFLPISGGTLTGALTLAGDPSTALQAVTKQYADNHFLLLTGGTLSGALIVNSTLAVSAMLTAGFASPGTPAISFSSNMNGVSPPGGFCGYIGFNFSAGQTEVDFINASTGGLNGFAFHQMTAGGTLSQLAWLDKTGTLTIAGPVVLPADPSAPLHAATKQYVDARGSGRVSVRTYGAKGDGVTDDTAAINACVAAVAQGGEIYFPIGQYRVSGTINLNKGLTVNGDGRLSSVILAASATADVFNITSTVDVYDMGFNTASGVTRTAGAYINVGGGTGRCRFDRFWMNGGFYGIRLTSAFQADCYASYGEILGWPSAGAGIRIDNGLAVQISHVLMQQGAIPGAGFGIYISNCGDVDLVACQIMGSGNCLYVTPGAGQTCASIWATECYFDSAVCGVHLFGNGGAIARCKFVGCWMSSMTSQGVSIHTSSGGSVGGIDFLGCHIFGNASDGATVFDSGCFDIQFNDCAVCGNSGYGIQMSTVQPWRIQNCRIGAAYGFGGNHAGGIFIGASADNYVVSSNQLTGNSVAAILGPGVQSGSNPGVTEFIYGNTGYVSQNRGQSTIPAGQLSTTVAHGLSGTPRLQDIFLTNLTGEGNPPGAAPFVLSPNSSTFVIELGVALGFNMGVSWQALLPCSI